MLSWLKRRNEASSPAESPAKAKSATEYRSDGNAWLDKGDLVNAEICYRQAVDADAEDALALINLAFVLNEQRRPAEARPHALKATALDATSVDAFFVLANAQIQESNWPAAASSLECVLRLKPEFEPAYGMLCRAYVEQNLPDKARATIQQGLRLNGNLAELHFYLGNLDMTAGNLDAAIASYARTTALAPSFSEAHQSLGQALFASGRQEEAIASLKRAVSLTPSSTDAHFKLGRALQKIGEYEAAAESYRAAIGCSPVQAELHDKLGQVLASLGDTTAASGSHRRAIALAPGIAEFHNNLGMVLSGQDAIACFEQALRLDSLFWVAHTNIGLMLFLQSERSEAIRRFRRALELSPDRLDVRGQLLFMLSFDESCSPEEYRKEAEAFGDLATRLAKPFQQWPIAAARTKAMPLRVGLVSGDLRSHPVGHFIEAIVSHLPDHDVELFAYVTDPREDDLTDRIRRFFSNWRSLVGHSHEYAAGAIRDDGIQVLVDLAGHTASNLLPVFAWRPAPVQVSWLGYWASTGMRAIDYVLADPQCVRPQEESHFTEQVWRLPDIRYCFTPPSPAPDVASLPALVDGRLTFGSFQKLAKISDTTIDLWAAVLRALPTARLRIQNAQIAQAAERDRLLARFVERAISANRVRLHDAMNREDYLRAHGEVDVILDTLPFTGGSTTCDALWMGVPTVTIEGSTMLTRQGASLMRTVGLSEWVAPDASSFVRTILAQVDDLQRLAVLRRELRERAKTSPLFDAPRFAVNLAAAFHALADRSNP